jgi:hypothetical protein
MPASHVGVVVRALILVFPSDPIGWAGLVVGLALGLAVDVAAWWALAPASFHRRTARFHAGRRLDLDGGQGDDDTDPDGGCALWVWCPVCDTYRLDAEDQCWCEVREAA